MGAYYTLSHNNGAALLCGDSYLKATLDSARDRKCIKCVIVVKVGREESSHNKGTTNIK
jgi:hypothetical protein